MRIRIFRVFLTGLVLMIFLRDPKADADVPDGEGEHGKLSVLSEEKWCQPISVGDFDGDGSDDLVIPRVSSDALTVIFSSFGRFWRSEQWQVVGGEVDWRRTLAVDVDGDGLTDLITPPRGSAAGSATRWKIFLSDGRGRLIESEASDDTEKWRLTVQVLPFRAGRMRSGSIVAIEDRFRCRELLLPGFLEPGSDPPGEIPVSISRHLLDANLRSFPLPNALSINKMNHVIWWRAGPIIGDLPGTPHSEWDQFAFADFNGDGHPDLFARDRRMSGPWVTDSVSVFELAVERYLPTSRPLRRPGRLFVGDFDGDSLDEILKVDDARDEYQIVSPLQVSPAIFIPGPTACIGYVPLAYSEGKWGRTASRCPPGYGVFETNNVRLESHSVAETVVMQTCCLLPNFDIFASTETLTEAECPANSIVIGREFINLTCPTCGMQVRCREINVNRYQLGEPRAGVSWGFRRYPHDQIGPSHGALPLAVRAGFGRISYDRWDYVGCMGTTLSSVLVALGSQCEGLRFRELQYRGLPGDPAQGTPVQIFPKCRKLENVFDPTSRCLE